MESVDSDFEIVMKIKVDNGYNSVQLACICFKIKITDFLILVRVKKRDRKTITKYITARLLRKSSKILHSISNIV